MSIIRPVIPNFSVALSLIGFCISFCIKRYVSVSTVNGETVNEFAMMFVPVSLGDRGERVAIFLNDVGLGDGTSHHDFVHEIDDCSGRLLWFQFGKHMTLIVRFVSGFPCHEAEAATEREIINKLI